MNLWIYLCMWNQIPLFNSSFNFVYHFFAVNGSSYRKGVVLHWCHHPLSTVQMSLKINGDWLQIGLCPGPFDLRFWWDHLTKPGAWVVIWYLDRESVLFTLQCVLWICKPCICIIYLNTHYYLQWLYYLKYCKSIITFVILKFFYS